MKITYIQGNIVADSFSRIDAFRLPSIINFEELLKAQLKGEELIAILQDNQISLKFQKLTFSSEHHFIATFQLTIYASLSLNYFDVKYSTLFTTSTIQARKSLQN